LLFEAFILMLSGQMPFAAVSRIVGESPHRVLAVCEKYVALMNFKWVAQREG
jgi:hypothetical protein